MKSAADALRHGEGAKRRSHPDSADATTLRLDRFIAAPVRDDDSSSALRQILDNSGLAGYPLRTMTCAGAAMGFLVRPARTAADINPAANA
jgi:hypothetical protein